MASEEKEEEEQTIYNTTTSYVQKQLLKGRFAQVVMKPGAKLQGTLVGDALVDWRQGLKREHDSNEDLPSHIYYEMPVFDPVPPPPVHGRKGTLSPTERSFIYLDVGAWIGTRGEAWGDDDPKKPGNYVKRDFGLVCGPLVMLCTFSYSHIKEHCAAWQELKQRKGEPFESVAKLIDALSKPALHDDGEDDPRDAKDPHKQPKFLGKAIVREAIVSPSAAEGWLAEGEKPVIHVIVGDMHIPVLDRHEQTFGKTVGKRGPVRKTADGETVEVTYPERVERLGRLDLGTIEAVVKALVAKDGTKLLDNMVKLANARVKDWQVATGKYDGKVTTGDKVASVATVEAGGAGVGAGAAALIVAPAALAAVGATLGAGLAATVVAAWALGDQEGIRTDTMTFKQAEEWYEYYRHGKDGGKPADIFERAGEHFLHFMGRLAVYQLEAAKHPDSMLRARFVQLGDMLDFWVGFTCHYTPSRKPDLPVNPDHATSPDMLVHWTNNLFGKTEQGQRVASAVDLAKHVKLDPAFLYGNHDNYLSDNRSIEYDFPSSTLSFKSLGTVQLDPEKTRWLDQRKAHFTDCKGVLMEHGHQWEGSNSNDAGLLGGVSKYTLGTSSPMGMFVTQASFIRPAPVRAFEGKAAGLLANISGTYGQRLDQVIGAAARFFLSGQGFYCYVMGHTHSAGMLTVVVSSQSTDKTRDFQKQHNTDPKCAIHIKGARAGDPKVVRNDWGPADVTVEWVEMLGSTSNEWMYLMHDGTPEPYKMEKAIKGLAMPNTHGVSGSETFKQVPPGLYTAHYYLTRSATKSFRPSPEKILIEGIGIEGDEKHEIGFTFEWDPARGFTKDIYLRWAYEQSHYMENLPHFEICRAEHANENAPPGGGHYYSAPFAQFGGDEAYRGRAELGKLCGGKSWDLNDKHGSPVGTWVVRAFSMFNRERMGAATFSIVQAKSSKAKK